MRQLGAKGVEMACPKCGCKTTYTYTEDDILGLPGDQERCPNCGAIFFVDDSAEDDGRYGDAGTPWKADIDAQTHPASAGDPGLF